jgi:hypothetical protein
VLAVIGAASEGIVVKSTLAFAAIAIATALALVGCSSGGSGGDNTTPPKPVIPAPTKTFGETDLVKILTTANASLKAGGTVTDLGLASSHNDNKPGDLYERILSEGGSITPTACGTLFDKIGSDVNSLGSNTAAYSARLDYGSSILSATSSSQPIDVSALTTLISGDLDSLTSQCASMNVLVHGATLALTFTKESETTDAGSTYSYSEHSTLNGAPLTSVVILGVDGNLLIGFEGLNGVTLADGDKAVNAVVAAAK